MWQAATPDVRTAIEQRVAELNTDPFAGEEQA